MNEPQLPFGRALARKSDPVTSHVAAKAIDRHANSLEQQIVLSFVMYGEMTDDELAAALPDRYPPSVKSARSRLVGDGRIVPTGSSRHSNRGQLMNVWRLAR